jgi:diguanylate cyclase (GGDEF)-like protein
MNRKPQAGRRKRLDYYEEAMRRIVASGLSPEQIELLKEYGLLATDNVTGFHEGRVGKGRISTLQKAVQHVKRTGELVFYVEMDVENLSGLNAALGHTRANEVYAKIAAIIRSELSRVASEAVFFRHGGDEMSVFLVGATEQAARQAFLRVRRRVGEVARAHGVHETPHPKHPHDRRFNGVGVHFGVSRVLARHEDDPTAVFRLADTELERHKRAGGRLRETAAHPSDICAVVVIAARPARCPAVRDLLRLWLPQRS